MGAKPKDTLCKKLMKFLFSHVGLCIMVVLYCVAGGFIFEHLEKNNEEQICYDSRDEYNDMEERTLNNTIKVIKEQEGSGQIDVLVIQLQSILATFRDNSIAIGYDGTNCSLYGTADSPKYKWSLPGAIFFSITVISTIGYGHIAPKTFWGRLVCIAYAVLGIPLMLLCLANIGDVLADIFRFIYAKICCCGWCRQKETTKVVTIKPMAKEPENAWNNDKAKIITSSGPMQTEFSRIQQKTPPSDVKPAPGADADKPKPVKIVPLDLKAFKTQQELANRSQPVRSEPIVCDDDSDDDDDDEFDDNKITVPLTVTMIVIAGYIFGGALLFGLWENWDNLQSAYFCFITLATIGFGDVVPGTDFDNPTATVQMILGGIYILFGMAIISMCFSLMQDEIIAKCKWVGEKLGIIDKDE